MKSSSFHVYRVPRYVGRVRLAVCFSVMFFSRPQPSLRYTGPEAKIFC